MSTLPLGKVELRSAESSRPSSTAFAVDTHVLRHFRRERAAGAQEERLRWLQGPGAFIPALEALLASIEAGGADVRPLRSRDAAPVVALLRQFILERTAGDRDLVESPLNLAWARVNALGWKEDCRCGECRDCGFSQALDQVLTIIEKLGGEDPNAARARERSSR